jgi:hypothetical protein
MKISDSGSVLDTNNNNADSLDFGIGDVSTIIDILRNRLYSNPIRTLTQEYLCNGRDSHRDAGNSNVPLRVTLPTKLDSVLKIRDFGTGLSPDSVKKVFVLYGKSTKREDNVQTGGFGIGAKSAWAYTDSFVVVSYYEGKCRTYIAHTGKNSNGTLELISEVDSPEPNGVEIQVPVKECDIEQFIAAVYRCTYFWDVKPELKGITNMEVPASWLTGIDKILYKKDNWFLLEKDELVKRLFDSYNQDIYVLIDKIPYSINKFSRECPEVEKLRSSSYAAHMSFIEVGNGVLEVSATRESISDKENSKGKVNQICEEARNSLHSCVEDQFKKDFKDIPSYINFYFKLKATFNLASFPKILDVAFKKNGCSYKLLPNGKIDSPTFNGCIIDRYNIKRQKSRRILNRAGNADISFNEEKSMFVLSNNDKNGRPVPEYVFKEKIKKLFANNDELSYVYVIHNYTEEQKNNIKDHLEAIYITDIQLDKPAYKNKKESGTVSIRYIKVADQRYGYFRGKLESETKEDVTLESIETSANNYISVPFSGSEEYDFDNAIFSENIKFLIEQGNYKIIKLSKRDYDAVNTLDNVMEYSDVAESISDHVDVDDKIIEAFVFKQANNAFEPLRKSLDKIDCDKIAEYFRIKGQAPAENRRNTATIPDRILAMYPYYSKVSDSVKKIAKLEEEITRKYPLMKQLSYIVGGYYGNNVEKNRELNEFIFYLNAKHSSGKAEVS